MPRAGRLRLTVTIVTLATCWVPGCRRGPELRNARPAVGPVDSQIRHVVLISIDTLRADRLGCYGHPFIKTPNIDRLAAEGILFEQHISAAPTTLNSHTSLMTGTWPHTHGVPRNGFVVNDRNEMLAEVLRDAGFTTAAFIGAYPLQSRFNFGQGFDHYDEEFDILAGQGLVDQNQRRAESVTNRVLEWLGARSPQRLFLFVHYFDVHAPYSPPAPYDRMYRSDDLPIDGSIPQINVLRRALGANPTGLAVENAAMDALYCGEVSYTDEHVGRLLDGLGERGLLEDSLLILTADHGETMNGHWELWDHGHSTYEATIRTPLIIRQPGARLGGRRLRNLVSNIDVMPTILDRLGVAHPARMEGVSFATLLDGEAAEPRESVFAEATKPWNSPWEDDPTWANARKCRTVRGSRWKFIHQPMIGVSELYDLDADPNEQANLLGGGSDLGAQQEARGLARRLTEWARSADPLASRFDGAPENIERLRALGYLGGDAEEEETRKDDDAGPDREPAPPAMVPATQPSGPEV